MTRMDQKLYERRVDSLKLHSRGVKPSIFSQELSQLYHVSPETVWHDWNRRQTWLPVVANMKDPELVMAECLIENREVKQAAWKLYMTGDNDNARVAALKIVLDANDRILQLVSPSFEFEERKQVVIRMWQPSLVVKPLEEEYNAEVAE